MHPTVLVVSFNDPLDPISAVNLSNYRITNPAGHPVRIRSAVFDAATNTVTLRPADRINLHHTYRFEVIGTGASVLAIPRSLARWSRQRSSIKQLLVHPHLAECCAEPGTDREIRSSKALHAGRNPELPFSQERDRPSPRGAV